MHTNRDDKKPEPAATPVAHATPAKVETDKQRKARIHLEIAEIGQQIADLEAKKAAKRAELAS